MMLVTRNFQEHHEEYEFTEVRPRIFGASVKPDGERAVTLNVWTLRSTPPRAG